MPVIRPLQLDARLRREFLHVDDMAAASVFVMELAQTVARVVGFEGELVFDTSKPDGTPRKLLDVSRLEAMGWAASVGLEEGLADTYRWFLDHAGEVRL